MLGHGGDPWRTRRAGLPDVHRQGLPSVESAFIHALSGQQSDLDAAIADLLTMLLKRAPMRFGLRVKYDYYPTRWLASLAGGR